MTTDYGGVYLPTSDPNSFESTPLTGAGWYEDGQHGGAVAGLFAHHLRTVPTLTEMQLARLTVEIFRIIPTTRLTIGSEIIREGKKIQLVQSSMVGPDGTLLAMATAQRLRVADLPTPAHEQKELTFDLPDQIESGHVAGPDGGRSLMFHRNAVDVRQVEGGFDQLGPGRVWIRMKVPLVADYTTAPEERAVVAADFGNGAGRQLDFSWVFMNSDITVHIGRYPQGEWIGLDSISNYSDVGRGVASSTLWDVGGWVGRSSQSLFVDRAAR